MAGMLTRIKILCVTKKKVKSQKVSRTKKMFFPSHILEAYF
jgi:hypothetical protein